ncbi:MAG: hypothetical protein AAGF11_54685 [Myxococcota bacterium]
MWSGDEVRRRIAVVIRWWGCSSVALSMACGGNDPGQTGSGSNGETGVLSLGPMTASSGAQDESADGGEKLDVNINDAGLGPGGDCPGGGGGMDGDVEFSLIWIANSPDGTVSKIDTTTGVELARYYTGPTDGGDDPSRTSVNLAGDVAVTNRAGGITKIAAREGDCVDLNGNGTIETSSGPTDTLPFGTDECVLWNVPLPSGETRQQGPRPTAWDAGESNNPCVPDDFRVWVGYFDRPANQGHFFRLAGTDGEILDEAIAPGWDATGGTKTYGPYGGAVDIEGNFWTTGLRGPLVRIDGTTLDVQQWEFPSESESYGMTLDANGHPWTAGLGGDLTHFDPDSEIFEVFPVGNNALRGLQIDRNGQLWAAVNGQCGVAQFDVETRTIVNANIPLPGCGTPVGVSIDVDGFVWIPDQGANLAFKLDPESYATTTTTGLIAPYTYSDMTGAGLGLVFDPPIG